MDSGYPSAALLVSSLASYGIALVTPMLADTSPQAALAEGIGVPTSRASTAAEFAGQLRRAPAEPGPHLIEALIPPRG